MIAKMRRLDSGKAFLYGRRQHFTRGLSVVMHSTVFKEVQVKAWLITWEWMGDAAAVADRVAAILNPRWSGERVGTIVEFLYLKCTANASEMAGYARRPRSNPYRAERDFNGRITCGSHPWLYARLVTDLSVAVDPETGTETITWTESPASVPTADGPKEVRGPLPGEVVRRITGLLSDELIWDRMEGTFKKGWEKTRPE